MNLTELAKNIHEDNRKKGFWDTERSNAECIALMHSELSEALEADRKDLMDDKLTHRKGFDVELADAIIRILDTCGARGIDIQACIDEKLEYNRLRPYKHGKNY